MKSERAFLTIMGVTRRQLYCFDERHAVTVPKNERAEHNLWLSNPSLVLLQSTDEEVAAGELDAGTFAIRYFEDKANFGVNAIEPLGNTIRVKVRDVRFRGQRIDNEGRILDVVWNADSLIGEQIIRESRQNKADGLTRSAWGPEWLLELRGKLVRWWVYGHHTRVSTISLLEARESIMRSEPHKMDSKQWWVTRITAAPDPVDA